MGCTGSKEKEPKAPAEDVKTQQAAKTKVTVAFEPKNGKQDDPIEVQDGNQAKKSELEKHAPKSVVRRLSVPVVSTPNDEAVVVADERTSGTKLFAAPKPNANRSKIYNALNPEKLHYESRREKEEQEDDKWTVSIRGGGDMGGRNYAVMADEEGNLTEVADVEDGEPVEEEIVDPKNLPDFGEFQDEMNQKRAERAEKLKQHQDKLRKEYLAKQAAEEQERQVELEKIRKKEAAQDAVKQKRMTEVFVEAQTRLQNSTFDSEFSFRAP